MLRASFTDRVYQKYRVILKPVAKNVDDMINKIKIDPITSAKKLEEEIRSLKQEKDIEKKEAQKINAALAANNANNADGSTSSSQQETADQLAFIGAGLSLVILPEEDISEYEIDPAEYPHRGPTNPETGSRVGGISAAAAAAAEVLLDRTRRSGAMRMERNRRRQLQLLSGEDAEAETDSTYSHLHLLSTTARPTPIVLPTAGPAETPSAAAASAAAKVTGVKRAGGTPRTSANAFPSTPPPPAAAKTSRARAQAAMSGSNLLSLNPNTEELMSSSGIPLASTSALIAKGVGSNTTSRSAEQLRWKHPHPDSLGGRRVAMTPSGKVGGSAMQSSSAANMSTYISLGLPPLPTARERKNRKPIPVEELSKDTGTERARIAVRSVLEHFYVQDGREGNLTKAETTSVEGPDHHQPKKDSDENATNTVEDKKTEETFVSPGELEPLFKRQKRRSTEIGLLRGMQRAKEIADIRFSEASKAGTSIETKKDTPDGSESEVQLTASAAPPQAAVLATPLPPQPRPPQSVTDETPIDPRLAFSVLYALGITHEPPKVSQPSDESYLSRLLTDASNSSKEEEPEYKKMIRMITLRKRPFSEAFLHFVPDLNDEPVEATVEQTRPDSDDIVSEKQKQTNNSSQPDESKVSPDKNNLDTAVGLESNGLDKAPGNPECPVASIRGGGEILVGSSDDDGSEPDKQTLSDATRASQQQSHASATEIIETGEATEAWSEFDVAPDRMHSYSPARALSNGVGATSMRMQGQQQYAHHSQHPMQLTHGHPQGPEMEYFGPSANFVAAQQEWAAASAAAVGFLPSAQSSIAALEYSSRRAALVVRERAARALIAREQAHAAAVHRHAAAAAVRSGAAVTGLSPQQAAVLMGSSHGYQQSAAAARFAHMGARNAAAMMNQQAGNPSMMGLPASAQAQVQAHTGRAQLSHQEGRKRSNPASSPGRGKAAPKRKKDPTPPEPLEDFALPVAEKAKPSNLPNRKRARAPSAGSTDSTEMKASSRARTSSAGSTDSAGGKPSSKARASSAGNTDSGGVKPSATVDAPKPAAKPVLVSNNTAPKNKDAKPPKDKADQNNGSPPLEPKKEIVAPKPEKNVSENTSPANVDAIEKKDTEDPKELKEPTEVAEKPLLTKRVPEASAKPANQTEPTKVSMPVPAPVGREDALAGPPASTSGMRFFVPKPPALLDVELIEDIIEGRIHDAVGKTREVLSKKQDILLPELEASLIQHTCLQSELQYRFLKLSYPTH